MQEVQPEYEQFCNDTPEALQFPTIALRHNISSWLEHSQIITMASPADDSSAEDTTSSIGDSTWDIVDDGSVAASDDEDRALSRQQTPSSDELERDPENGASLAGNNTSDESHGMSSTRGQAVFAHARNDSSSDSHEPRSSASMSQAAQLEEDMEDTNVALRPIPSLLQQSQPFKFQEPQAYGENVSRNVEVYHVLKKFDGESLNRICTEFDLGPPKFPLVGTVRQKMNYVDSDLPQPYQILFVGSASAKEQIMQKIGSALASALGSRSTNSEAGRSRFTVVPISAFGDGESPEVLLVNSIGIDMSVEECTSASLVKDNDWEDTISLKLNDHKTLCSSWSRSRNAFVVSEDYKLPDIAIIYLDESESLSTKQTRTWARTFMIRHGIPVIIISADSGWKKPNHAMTLDLRTPHLCIESITAQGQILRRLPIDLSTFLDIDASQMGMNLACIASTTLAAIDNKVEKQRTIQSPSVFAKALGNRSSNVSKLVPKQHRTLSLYGACLLTGVLLYSLAVVGMHFSRARLLPVTPVNKFEPAFVKTASISSTSIAAAASHSPVYTSTTLSSIASATSAQAPSKNVIPVRTDTDLASFLLDSKLPSHIPATNRSDKFKLHILGDCHIVLRPPQWYTSLRRPPTLHFNVTRKQEGLWHETSVLFDGVYALKLAREDAYGVLDISVWTTRKPRINNTFQVDFGTPWLKLAGWKKGAQALTEQIREELQSAQTGLNLAYGQTSIGVQTLLRDAVKKAESVLKEVEKVSLASLNTTAKTTELMIAQSRELSSAISQQLHRHSFDASSCLAVRRHNIRKAVYKYTIKISSILTQQAQMLTEAATGLNVMSLAQEMQEYRERHLRETQKRALHMWWKMRGVTPRKRAEPIPNERPRARYHRSQRGTHR